MKSLQKWLKQARLNRLYCIVLLTPLLIMSSLSNFGKLRLCNIFPIKKNRLAGDVSLLYSFAANPNLTKLQKSPRLSKRACSQISFFRATSTSFKFSALQTEHSPCNFVITSQTTRKNGEYLTTLKVFYGFHFLFNGFPKRR